MSRLSSAILIGTVMQVDQENGLDTASVQVEQYLKGAGPAAVSIGRLGSSAMCLQTVSVGSRMVFFAAGDPRSGRLDAAYFYAGAAAFAVTEELRADIVALTGVQQLPDSINIGVPVTPPADPALAGFAVVFAVLMIVGVLVIGFVLRRKMR